MKKYLLIALSLFLLAGTPDVSAQGFLKDLGKSVKKEVGKRVKKEVKNRVKKAVESAAEDQSQEQVEEVYQEEFQAEEQSKPQAKQTTTKSATSKTAQSKQQSDDIFTVAQKIVSVTTIDAIVEYGPTKGKLNGHEWIDLGLPSGVRWAACNMDATSPEQAGKFYSWAETSTKNSYVESTSKTHNKAIAEFSGNATYDVATQKWGKGWRMPTEEEFKELMNYTDSQFKDRNGRKGREYANYVNNNKLFIPAAGSNEEGKLHNVNGCGSYWTSTPIANRNTGAISYIFNAPYDEMSTGERYYGYSVRPVTDYDVEIEIPYDGETNGHKWVDLGLPSGLKWAAYNVGTEEMDQDGNHYKWGSLVPYADGVKYAKDDVKKDITGNSSYDAATAQWGAEWYMPTVWDFAELMDNCTFEWTSVGRRNGLKVTSKINGKYIFLPASGEFRSTAYDFESDINKALCYWTSSYVPGWQNAYNAFSITLIKDKLYISQKERSKYGFPIRPVTK